MGKWCAAFLKGDFEDITLVDTDAGRLAEVQRELEVGVSTEPRAVRGADVVLTAVPLATFEQVVQELEPYVSPGQLLIDISSLKVPTMAVLHRHLRQASVLGVHPMFGPGARGVRNRNVLVTPDNSAEEPLAGRVGAYLKGKGAKVTVISPEEHDELMGLVLGLPSFVAMAAADTLVDSNRLGLLKNVSGTSFRLLLLLVEAVLSQDEQLYGTMQMTSASMQHTQQSFGRSVIRWTDLFGRRDQSHYASLVTRLKAGLRQSDPEFEKAYQHMYDLLDALDAR